MLAIEGPRGILLRPGRQPDALPGASGPCPVMLAAGAPCMTTGAHAALKERWSGDIRGGLRRVRGGHVPATAANGVPALRRLAYRRGSCAGSAGEGVRVLAQNQ